MKGIYEKTIEVNSQPKVNVDEQHNDIKYLKEQCNKDDKDKIQEFLGPGTVMKKDKSVCVPCNQTLQKKEIVEKSHY